MDNAVQNDLHTAIIVLKKTRPSKFTIPRCFLHSAYFPSDLPANMRHSRVDVRIAPRDCGPTLLGPT